MFSDRHTAADILNAIGGVGGALDALRRNSQAQQRQQENMQRAKMNARNRPPDVDRLLRIIYRENARFFDSVIITDATWTK